MRIDERDLGAIVKAARNKRGMTQEVLSEKVGIGTRHLMSVENECGTPSYDVLYKLIRELHIPTDTIFYPESTMKNPLIEEIIRILYDCDERSLSIIHATAQAAFDSQTIA